MIYYLYAQYLIIMEIMCLPTIGTTSTPTLLFPLLFTPNSQLLLNNRYSILATYLLNMPLLKSSSVRFASKQPKTGILPISGCVSTTSWIHCQDANEMHVIQARVELYDNVPCCFKQIPEAKWPK